MLASACPGWPGIGAGLAGFSIKTGDAPVLVHAHDTKPARRLQRNIYACDCHVCGFLHVIGQQFAVVHFINVITAQDQHVFRIMDCEGYRYSGYTASAVPWYQVSSMRCCAGSSSTNSSNRPSRKPHPCWIWLIRLCALYCVATPIRRMPELTQLERGKSIMRNLPPKGTAGLARQSVSCRRRLPRPPASMNAIELRVIWL